MKNLTHNNTYTGRARIITGIVLFEYLLFIYSGVSFSFLYGDHFFSLEADPATWAVYMLDIPAFILTHQWLGIFADVLIVFFLLLFARDPSKNVLAIILFILLFIFYATLSGHLAHRNYQTGFFLVFIPFIFRKQQNRAFAFEAARYFLLFFYVSAACLKLWGHALTTQADFSHLISGQFTPYYLEGNTGIRTDFNLYLINHPTVAHLLYIVSFSLELVTCIGFFTKRFDKWIGIILLTFHFTNWFVMDIAPFGHIAFICLLFMSKQMGLQKE